MAAAKACDAKIRSKRRKQYCRDLVWTHHRRRNTMYLPVGNTKVHSAKIQLKPSKMFDEQTVIRGQWMRVGFISRKTCSRKLYCGLLIRFCNLKLRHLYKNHTKPYTRCVWICLRARACDKSYAPPRACAHTSEPLPTLVVLTGESEVWITLHYRQILSAIGQYI